MREKWGAEKQYYYGDHVKEHEIGRACSRHWRDDT